MNHGSAWFWHNQGDVRRNQRYNNNNNNFHRFNSQKSYYRQFRGRSNRNNQMHYPEDRYQDNGRMYCPRDWDNSNNIEEFRDYLNTPWKKRKSYDSSQASKKLRRMDYDDQTSPVWEEDMMYESPNTTDRFTRSRSVPRSLERLISVTSRSGTPIRTVYKTERNKEVPDLLKERSYNSRFQSENEESIYDDRNIRKCSERMSRSSSTLSSPPSPFRKDLKTEINEPQTPAAPKHDSSPLRSNSNLQNVIEKLKEEKVSPQGQNITGYDGSPVGEDGITRCIVFRCSYCIALCADKETADKHVRSEIHYQNFKKAKKESVGD